MELTEVHTILIIGPTISDKNVDLSTALYDTVDILHQLGYKTSIIVEDPTSLLSSGTFFDKTVAAIIGNAAFFEPLITTSPFNICGPFMIYLFSPNIHVLLYLLVSF